MWFKIFSVSRGKLISVICLLQLCYGDKWNCDSEGGGEAPGATTPQMQQPKTTAKSQPAKDDAPLKEAPNDIGRHNERFASKVGFFIGNLSLIRLFFNSPNVATFRSQGLKYIASLSIRIF